MIKNLLIHYVLTNRKQEKQDAVDFFFLSYSSFPYIPILKAENYLS